jgi:hypothetical protein
LSMPGDVLKSERIERWQRAKVKCLDYKRWLSSDIIGNLSYFPRKEARRRNVPKVDSGDDILASTITIRKKT